MRWRGLAMQSKTSWFKKEIFKQNFRQVGWVSLIYLIILFFAVPLNIFMRFQRHDEYYGYFGQSVFEYGVYVQLFSLFIAPVLMAMFILRYLHQKDSSDFIYSLPIKRDYFYWHQVAFGFIGLLLPVIINGLLVSFVYNIVDVQGSFNINDIGYWFVVSSIILFLTYSVSIVIGTMTGITIIQGIFSYIFLLLPFGFTLLFISNLNYFVIGLPESYLIDDKITTYSPITNIVNLIDSPEDASYSLIIYVILTILFFIVGLILYRNRPAEAATQAVAFHKLKYIFIYSFTFCFTLIGGIYFAIFHRSTSAIIFGYLIFSVIGYYITQMIIHKTWRVFNEWREYIYYLIGFSIILLLTIFDVTGYQNRIPETDQVESAFVVIDKYSFNENLDKYGDLEGFTTQVDIDRVREYHQQLINSNQLTEWYDSFYKDITILYRLKNGKEMVREYRYSDQLDHQNLLDEITQTQTYKKYTNEIFYVNPKDISQIRIVAYPTNSELTITNYKEISEFVDLFKQDLLSTNRDSTPYSSTVEVHFNDNLNQYYQFYDLSWNNKEVMKWLENNDLLEQAMMTAEDVEKIIIATPDDLEEYYYYDEREYFSNILSESRKSIITDADQINQILTEVTYEDFEGDHLLVLYLKDTWYPYVIKIQKSQLPDEVINNLN
mgnify:CR=1 FL=1